ncbi:MAG: sugar ABC transporter permease [Caldilineaceae bacterium]
MTAAANQPGVSVSASRRSHSNRRWLSLRRNLDGWLFASPWIIGFILWTLGPMLASLFIAFTEWELIGAPKWVGAANVQAMFHDDLVWQSLKVTTLYALFSVPLHIIFGMIIALLLNQNIGGLRFYRTAYYLPSMLSGVAVALL